MKNIFKKYTKDCITTFSGQNLALKPFQNNITRSLSTSNSLSKYLHISSDFIWGYALGSLTVASFLLNREVKHNTPEEGIAPKIKKEKGTPELRGKF